MQIKAIGMKINEINECIKNIIKYIYVFIYLKIINQETILFFFLCYSIIIFLYG